MTKSEPTDVFCTFFSQSIIIFDICALYLVSFVQFKKRKKHPLFYGCFLHFLNCTNDTKSPYASVESEIKEHSEVQLQDYRWGREGRCSDYLKA